MNALPLATDEIPVKSRQSSKWVTLRDAAVWVVRCAH